MFMKLEYYFMIKRAFIFFCVMVFSLLGHAQEAIESSEKSTVMVDYFTCFSGVQKEVADLVRNNVLQSVVSSGRVIALDMESDKVQANEKLRRTRNDLSIAEDNNMERLSAIGVLGAEYIVSGQIMGLGISRKEKTNKKGNVKVSYEAKLMYTIKVIRVKDGIMVGSESYTEAAKGDTESEVKAAVVSKAGKVTKYIQALFRVKGEIVEVSKEKDGKAEEVYINKGTNNGVAKNLRFTVYAVRQIAGKNVNKEIGEISVKAVEGEDISCCKVKKGGALILESMREGETLMVKSN